MHSTVLASTTQVIWNALESYGCDSSALFRTAGLDPEALRDPNARYRYASVRTLWKHAVEASGDPCLGLTTAHHWHPTNFHGLGYALMASATLKDALERTVRYFRIVSTDPEALELVEHTDNYQFVIGTDSVEYRALDEEYDMMMALFMDVCRATCGSGLRPLRITVEHEAPECAERYAEYFAAPVEFGAPNYALFFDKADVERPLPTANAELALANEKVVQHYIAHLDRSDVVMQVKIKIIEQLPSGHVAEGAIARSLNMSLRSLQRRLREDGTSYKELLDETRRDLARQYIQDSRVSINEMTYLLGFSEPSNFSRAFKRWTGKSPTAYRLSA
ncbi:MAG: AraC family transcriptional regulator [Pseudomonadota bacterium]|nr:MAG: AraC family transcriptional regulator [Pseudomonadota bacterium]